MVVAAVVNVGLDPILIFGFGPVPELGTGGAALGTTIGRILAAVLALIWAVRRGYVALGRTPLEGLRTSAREIVEVGGPAAFSNAINPAGMAAVTAAVATVGDAAVAGFGAATRVQTLLTVPLLALSAGIGPVVGQSWGADDRPRARRALRLTHLACIGYGLGSGLLLVAFAPWLAAFVTGGGEGTAEATLYLRIVALSMFGYGILVTTNAAMNARSRAVPSMVLSLARLLGVYLPGAWIGVALIGYPGILIAAASANVAAALGAVYAARRTDLWGGGGVISRPRAGSDAPAPRRPGSQRASQSP
ncbi:MAG: MATE family efflux transporter [Shimia sp.]